MFEYSMKTVPEQKKCHEVFYGGQLIGMINETKNMGVIGTLTVQTTRDNGDVVSVTRTLDDQGTVPLCFARMQRHHEDIIENLIV